MSKIVRERLQVNDKFYDESDDNDDSEPEETQSSLIHRNPVSRWTFHAHGGRTLRFVLDRSLRKLVTVRIAHRKYQQTTISNEIFRLQIASVMSIPLWIFYLCGLVSTGKLKCHEFVSKIQNYDIICITKSTTDDTDPIDTPGHLKYLPNTDIKCSMSNLVESLFLFKINFSRAFLLLKTLVNAVYD